MLQRGIEPNSNLWDDRTEYHGSSQQPIGAIFSLGFGSVSLLLICLALIISNYANTEKNSTQLVLVSGVSLRGTEVSGDCDDTALVNYKKLCYREEHSASVVLSWCTLWHFSGENLFIANQSLSRNWPRKLPNSAK